MKLKPLNAFQKAGWTISSLTFGIVLLWFGFHEDLFSGVDRHVAMVVFGICWLVGVLLLRVFMQDKSIDNMTGLFQRKRQ